MQDKRVRSRTILAVVAAGAVMLAASCSGASAPAPARSSGAPPPRSTNYTVLTPAPTTNAGDITWATYRDVQTLDPILAGDYPENTIDSLMCDSLLRQGPDQKITNGLATLTTPSTTEFDFAINAKAKFWDGSPVTAADAVFSLRRAADPKGPSYYAGVFSRVSSITATGDKTFKITLKKPDYWLLGELSSMGGEIVQQKYATAKGKNFGTISGGTMCSGPFKLASWKTGQGVKVVPNKNYWDTRLPKPKVTSLTLIGVPTDAALTAGLETGAISGSYPLGLSTLSQLETSPNLKVYRGRPFATEALIITATKGPLANLKVRQALSYAIDRKGLIKTVYKGAASVPHALLASGTWGYARDVFSAGYDALPAMNQDMTKAKELITQAGVAGQTITLGTSSGIATRNTEGLAIKAAAESIGLKVVLQNVSPSNYFNYFSDPKAYGSIDAFSTTNYGDYADPSALYITLAVPRPIGNQNYNGYSNPKVTADLNAARSEPDPTKRAQYTVAAQKIITEQLVWIPLVAPDTVLVMNKKVTGPPATFSYMNGPWAAYLGGTGR